MMSRFVKGKAVCLPHHMRPANRPSCIKHINVCLTRGHVHHTESCVTQSHAPGALLCMTRNLLFLTFPMFSYKYTTVFRLIIHFNINTFTLRLPPFWTFTNTLTKPIQTHTSKSTYTFKSSEFTIAHSKVVNHSAPSHGIILRVLK